MTMKASCDVESRICRGSASPVNEGWEPCLGGGRGTLRPLGLEKEPCRHIPGSHA